MITIAVVSLGCDKNRVDTEKMLYKLKDNVVVTDDFASADAIIVNTCAFIESAREESINTILEMAEYKSVGKCKKLIVTGCLPQRYLAEIKDELPEVDVFLGTNDYEKILEALEQTKREYVSYCESGALKGRILTTPPHYAYLKIADGCDNHCTYCMIPSIRGKYRSTPIEQLIEEAQELVKSGVKELILVAQDVTRYGFDLYGKYTLIELIRRLSKLDLTWIRLMYCYPELVSDELIEEISSNEKVVKYIDIPLQHVDDGVLRRMNRKSSYASINELMDKLSSKGIAIRTTLMVGFPGETQQAFDKLLDFVKKQKLRHVGVFAYSDEDVPSAKLDGKVDEKTKQKRAAQIAKAHKKNVEEFNKTMIGKTLCVLYEDIDFDKNLFKGRTEDCAPEIDTCVYFKADFADVGSFYNVLIKSSKGYDLIGELK